MKLDSDTRVLVTGADGFIGSHLTEALVKKGARVRALSYYNSFNTWGWLEDLSCLPDIEVLSGDVRDPYHCNQIAKDMDVVFHLAALIAIPYSYAAPASYIDTNVQGTLNMCQAALKNGCQRFVQTSTSEVYGTARYVPIDETHPLQPQSPYSASKIGEDMIARSHYYSFNWPVVVARPFNTFGPRQSARAVIPTIIAQISAGAKEIHLGDLRPTRDFNYVEDTCRGFISLAECAAAIGDTVNIGSNREVSIGETVQLICEFMRCQIRVLQTEERLRPQNSEVQRLWCDNRKINALTGYKPQVTLEQGLERTIEWFSKPANLARYKASIYNV
jgi:NAD dependent epimerase/dehydratase